MYVKLVICCSCENRGALGCKSSDAELDSRLGGVCFSCADCCNTETSVGGVLYVDVGRNEERVYVSEGGVGIRVDLMKEEYGRDLVVVSGS